MDRPDAKRGCHRTGFASKRVFDMPNVNRKDIVNGRYNHA